MLFPRSFLYFWCLRKAVWLPGTVSKVAADAFVVAAELPTKLEVRMEATQQRIRKKHVWFVPSTFMCLDVFLFGPQKALPTECQSFLLGLSFPTNTFAYDRQVTRVQASLHRIVSYSFPSSSYFRLQVGERVRECQIVKICQHIST